MDAPLFAGVGVALVTLFDDGGALDAAATADLAASLADEGMTAIVIAGSTGEAATLDPANGWRWSAPCARPCPPASR